MFLKKSIKEKLMRPPKRVDKVNNNRKNKVQLNKKDKDNKPLIERVQQRLTTLKQ